MLKDSPKAVRGKRPSLGLTLQRLACLARFHRPAQFAHRLAQVVRRRCCASREGRRYELSPNAPLPALRANNALAGILSNRLEQRKENAAARAAAVHAGRFCFLSVENALADPIDWRLCAVSDAVPLWRFHLHYQEYLLDLAAAARQGDSQHHFHRAWELVDSWIDGNHPSDRRTWADAWHPYCIARRLPVWMLLWTAEPPEGDFADRMLQSMFLQARFLARHLERDLGGNHLLEDLRALAMAGSFFVGVEADRWLDQASRLLHRELDEQILPHGEHFERSPMYHCQMLDAVLDIRDATLKTQPTLSATCRDAAAKMAKFVLAIIHPDGQIPLLGDSALDEAGDPRRLAERAGVAVVPLTEGSLHVGDYWRFADRGDCLLLDAGPVGPDHLPAHAHADLLTIEASMGGRRLLVDSGVYSYQDDAMRAYCRGTAAHNTLVIDGVDQCDVYSRFRMGRRGWPRRFACGETEGFAWGRAEHDAYRGLGIPRVQRYLACRKEGPWFCVDRAFGRGYHVLTSWLHIHPDWHVEAAGETELRIVWGETRLALRTLGPCRMELAEGWYCPEFGLRVPSVAVCLRSEGALPAAFGWMLHREEQRGEATLELLADQPPMIVFRDEGGAANLSLENVAQPPSTVQS